MRPLNERLAAGEHSAFAELYDSCAESVFRWLVVRLGSRDDAADVLQETFARLVRARGRLAGVDNLSGYVFRVAYNESARLQSLRARAGRTIALDASALQVAAPDASTINDFEKQERAKVVARLLNRLPPAEREVVELKTLGGRTLKEISEITETPPGTVATRYRSALDKLRRWLIEQCHE